MPSEYENALNRRFSHMILFDEKDHVYTVDGVKTPSVTDILAPLHRSYGKINQSVLEYAARRGSAVHEALEEYDLGLDFEATPEIIPYMQAYFDWESIYKPRWTGIEQIVFCEEGWFVGTLDRVGYLNDGKLAIVDIKTSQPTREAYASVCLQTTAYAMAHASQNGFMADAKGYGIEDYNRYGLFLLKDGKYRLLDCKEWEGTNHVDAAMAFGSLLSIYKLVSNLITPKKKEKGKK